MGFYFKARSAQTLPEATWSAREGKTIVLVSLACDTSNNGRLCTSYERDQVGVRGRGKAVGAGEEVERELVEMTGSLEQLAGLEEKEEEEGESGSSVRGSENCLHED